MNKNYNSKRVYPAPLLSYYLSLKKIFLTKDNLNDNKYLSHKSGAGFTIIELIVVIAIIAVLAAIVLVNVTSYITKGRDAAARGNLATMLTNGAVFYDGSSSYQNFITNTAVSTIAVAAQTPGNCSTPAGASGFIGPCQALTGAVGGTGGYAANFYCSTGAATTNCNATTTVNWCGQITLKQGAGTTTYCVDSNGNKKGGGTTSGACTAATGICG